MEKGEAISRESIERLAGKVHMVGAWAHEDGLCLKQIREAKGLNDMREGPLHVVILNGTMRPRGNTAQLLRPMMEELMLAGAHVQYVTLSDKKIAACDACWQCQHVWGEPGCPKDDDMVHIYKLILHAHVLVLATPIYTGYCTPPMKCLLDRLYALSKYYGRAREALLAGKGLALVCTCGYPQDQACRPFEDGMIQYAAHAKMDYLGMLAHRDEDDLASFQTAQAVGKARAFAQMILRAPMP